MGSFTLAHAAQKKASPAAVPATKVSTTSVTANPLWQRLAVGIQLKLAVSAPDDPYEREADAVADRVMRMAEPGSIGAVPTALQRKCSACEEEQNETIQAKRGISEHAHGTPDAGAAARAARHGGTPLSKELRSYLEPRFGYDFSGVRVHADSSAARSAAVLSARAYTVGPDIVFGRNQYAPSTADGLKLLAHELAHVVQQRGGSAGLPRKVDRPGHSEAMSASEAAVAGRDMRLLPVSLPMLHRQSQTLDQAKASVLEELNRSMPVAILSMLDTMDAQIRARLQTDADVLSAIKKLPPGAQLIVLRHLNPPALAGAPQGAAGQPRPAEQIAFSTSADYQSFGLHEDNARQAVGIFGKTDLANDLMAWFAKHNIQVRVKFIARRRDLPQGKGEIAGVDGTYAKEGNGWTAYVLGSEVFIDSSGTATDQASDRRAESMAKTVFHELLHIWFVNGAGLSPSDPFYTGHTAEAAPPSIGPTGMAHYDEAQYDPRFLAKLKEFDAELAARKKAVQSP
jgi:hypothetical protein